MDITNLNFKPDTALLGQTAIIVCFFTVGMPMLLWGIKKYRRHRKVGFRPGNHELEKAIWQLLASFMLIEGGLISLYLFCLVH